MIEKVNEEHLKNEVYRELEKLVVEMNSVVDAVVVEGPHDKKTLRVLGFKKSILLCAKASHNELTDLVTRKFTNVAILTDFDEEGMVLNKKLTTLFEMRGIKVDRFYRKKFQKLLTEARLLTIESIYNIKLRLFPVTPKHHTYRTR